MVCPWDPIVNLGDVCPSGLTPVLVSTSAQFQAELANPSGKRIVATAPFTTTKVWVVGHDNWCIVGDGNITSIHDGSSGGANGRFADVNNAAVTGVKFDNGGNGVWGVTISGAYTGDPDHGRPVTDFKFINNEVTGTKQAAIQIGGIGTNRIDVKGNWIHDWGTIANRAEGVYVGNGGDRSQSDATNVHIKGNHFARNHTGASSGEGIDIKNNTGKNGTLTTANAPGETFGIIIEENYFTDIGMPFNAVISVGENGNSNVNTTSFDADPGPTTGIFRNAIDGYLATGNFQVHGIQIGRGDFLVMNNLVTGAQSNGDAFRIIDNAAPGERARVYNNGFDGDVDWHVTSGQTYSLIEHDLDKACNWYTGNWSGEPLSGGEQQANAADFIGGGTLAGFEPVPTSSLVDACPNVYAPTDICGTARVADDDSGPFSLAQCCALTTAGQQLLQQAANTCGLQNLTAQQLTGCPDFQPGASVSDNGTGITVTMSLSSMDIDVTGPGTFTFDDGC